MRTVLARWARAHSLLTWTARAALADGCTPETIRDGQGAGPLSGVLAGRMAETGGGS
jgi:hypothetical protein